VIANAFLLTAAIFLAMGVFLMEECRFLIPYRQLLWTKYAELIATFAAVLFVDLFAGIYWLGRKVFLKDTGRKLAHLEKQLRTGSSLSEELSERLKE
jgi:hypothetical protein